LSKNLKVGKITLKFLCVLASNDFTDYITSLFRILFPNYTESLGGDSIFNK
jgi:hypothetical protein